MESSRAALVVMCALALVFHAPRAQNSVQDYVDRHNAARRQVGVGDLAWDDTVAGYAQEFANNRTVDCALVHSKTTYGENVFMGTGNYSAVDAINIWIAEKQNYDYNTNACASGYSCGHYTQVVWRNSECLGCARVMCNNGSIFITCNYNPAGNVLGQRPY